MFKEKTDKEIQDLRNGKLIWRIILLYIPGWIGLMAFEIILIVFTKENFLFINSIRHLFGYNFFSDIFILLYVSLLAAAPIIFVEKKLKKQKKLEQEAKQNLRIDEYSGAVDKTDIRYWHGLLKDGIIDQKEFDKKKKELV